MVLSPILACSSFKTSATLLGSDEVEPGGTSWPYVFQAHRAKAAAASTSIVFLIFFVFIVQTCLIF